MEIAIHAKVNCIDGHGGAVSHIILNPVTDVISHIVVSYGLVDEERVVPIEMIADSGLDGVQLRCTCDELHHLPSFFYDEYVKKEVPYYSYVPGEAMYAPLIMEGVTVPVRREDLPDNELAIRRGARVMAADGPIGRVDEFLVDPTNDRITHLVLREGHLWGRRDVTIPVNHIARVEEDQVLLNIDRQAVGELPSWL